MHNNAGTKAQMVHPPAEEQECSLALADSLPKTRAVYMQQSAAWAFFTLEIPAKLQSWGQ